MRGSCGWVLPGLRRIRFGAAAALIPEDLALFDNLTAREYLTFIGRMHLRAVERAAGVHRAIAQKLVQASVQLVRAGPGLHAHHGSTGSPELRAERIRRRIFPEES